MPHAGFGFDRTLAYVTGLSAVRDAIPLHAPRQRQVLRRFTSELASPGTKDATELGTDDHYTLCEGQTMI
jgi:hypothetical protein